MSGMRRTLLVIAGLVALILGSFIWFIASWDKSKEEPVNRTAPAVEEDRRV